jgi:DNA-directed RNA polymerase subunit E'/Rpb7
MSASSSKVKSKRREIKVGSIYTRALITRTISVPITAIGKNIQDTIDKTISSQFEGKCIVEGFVKRGSIRIVTFSSGLVRATHIVFEVVFECQICSPVEGMILQCVAKNVTKAGIRAESSEETPSPIMVFVTRDHNYSSSYFTSIKEGDNFQVRVVGQRFELNDPYVSVIGDVIEPKEPTKRKLVIGNED